MYHVVNTPGGTAKEARMDSIVVCGKTGTAQNSRGTDHAWFVCFAPMDDPKIAIAVLVEEGGFGGVTAAPIARKMMEHFFEHRPHTPEEVEQNDDEQTLTLR
jgi:penicillin-binding protein 2